MWVNDEAKEILQEQQSHRNPAQLTFDILTGTGTMAKVGTQLQNTAPPTVYRMKEVALHAWAKVNNALSDGSFVKIFQGPREEYVQFLGKLKDVIKKSIKDANLQQRLLKHWPLKMLMRIIKM